MEGSSSDGSVDRSRPLGENPRILHSLYEPHPKDATANYTLRYGCLPVEITYQLAAYFDYVRKERDLDIQSFGQAIVQVNGLMDVMSTCERILRTRMLSKCHARSATS